MEGLLGALNTFSPVIDEYMDDMNESRQPHELICKQMLEKTEIKLDSRKDYIRYRKLLLQLLNRDKYTYYVILFLENKEDTT